jgi:hypothetical protein
MAYPFLRSVCAAAGLTTLGWFSGAPQAAAASGRRPLHVHHGLAGTARRHYGRGCHSIDSGIAEVRSAAAGFQRLPLAARLQSERCRGVAR